MDDAGTISPRYVPAFLLSTMGDRKMGNSSAGSMKPASRIIRTFPRAGRSDALALAFAPPPRPCRFCTVNPWCAASASASSALQCSNRATSTSGMACLPYVALIISSALPRIFAKYLCNTHACRNDDCWTTRKNSKMLFAWYARFAASASCTECDSKTAGRADRKSFSISLLLTLYLPCESMRSSS